MNILFLPPLLHHIAIITMFVPLVASVIMSTATLVRMCVSHRLKHIYTRKKFFTDWSFNVGTVLVSLWLLHSENIQLLKQIPVIALDMWPLLLAYWGMNIKHWTFSSQVPAFHRP